VAGQATHVAKSSPICPQGAVVEIKRKIVEGKEGKSRGRWPGYHTWPPLNSHFHSSPYLVPLMLTPLAKSIKSKANSLHFFQSFIYFLYFMRCNDAINKYAMENEEIKMVHERGEKMQMVEEGWKRKYEITTGLFSR
jgi:hypothetical protein